MRLVVRLLCCTLLACASGALAQGYPNRPIRILVGFTPGGTTDVVALPGGNGTMKRMDFCG